MIVLLLVLATFVAVLVRRRGSVAKRGAVLPGPAGGVGRERRQGPGRLRGSGGGL